MQGLGEVLVGRSFALADTGSLGLGEGLEEVVGIEIAGIGQFNCPCSQRQALELCLHTGGLVDGIKQRFGRQSLDPVIAIETGVGDIGPGWLGTQLVEPAGDDGPQQCLEIVVALDKVLGQGVHQCDVGGGIGGTQVVDRLDQATAQQVTDVAIDNVPGKELVLFSGEPLGEWDTEIQGVLDRLAAQRRRLAGGSGLDDHDRLTTEESKLLASLGAHSLEEGGESVVVALAVFLEGVMMALGTLEPNAQEELGGRFGQIVGVAVDAEVVGRSGRVD